jgi:Tol biopolymer transport system component
MKRVLQPSLRGRHDRNNLGILATLLVLALSGSTFAQHAREVFGTNRIQYKDFKWTYITSENFDIYYYDSRKVVATEVANYLEGEFDRITDLIGYPPYLKTKVFLYNSVADLKQSNIGLNRNPYIMGGETEFIQPYVEIAHPGTLLEFKEELLLKVADLMVNEMMFGGSLKDMFQQSVLLNLPEWFTKGASLYAAKGWDSEMDDFARQLVRSRKANRATNLTGKEAALAGQSIWNYIAEKYGKSSLSNILNYSRVIRNEQRSVLITLGVPFRQLMSDWKQFYLSAEQRVSSDYVFPADSNRFSPSHRKTAVYTAMKISPDGRYFAYAENDRGKYVVKVKSLENEREMTILNGGLKVLNQTVDYRTPLLNWSDDHTLGVIGEDRGKFVFWLYDLNTRSKLPRELDKFNNIRSFDFSANGRLVVLSAEQDGQNDLFLLSSRRDRIRRLTNDIFDDLDPSFIPNSNSIVFSSNRTTDTVNVKRGGFKDIRTNDYNLFIYDLDSTANVVERVTNAIGKDYYPNAIDENTIFYLSDQRGITNLFRYNRQTKIYTQVTNFASGIKEYDIDFGTNTFAMVATKRLTDDIFVVRNFDRNRQIFTPATKRQDMQQAKQLVEKRKSTANKNMSLKDLINQRLKETNPDTLKVDSVVRTTPQKPDSVKQKSSSEVNTENYSFEDAPPVAPPKETLKTPTPEKKTVSTEDYKFEDEEVKKINQPSETFLNRYLKTNTATRINGPFPYQPKFSWDNVVANIVIDPIRGWSLKGETQMNDMLENFRLTGGIQVSMTDWKSGDVYAEVQYLPKRIDYGLRLDRKTIYGINTLTGREQKYAFQKIEVSASMPLLTRLRVSLKPFVGFTRFVDRGISTPSGPPQFLASQQQFYGGAKGELVFDNSITTGLNIVEGTRAKASFINYQAMGNRSKSFSQLVVDIRHYQKIYREIVFAIRGYGGSFMGAAPKQYVLGGMDNWIGNRTNYEGVGNPLSQFEGFNQGLLFLEFATSLRGFDYATFYGTSALVGNAELRVPLVRAFSSGPIASNFFRNMQFTAFYDIGTSWTGKPSFSGEQSARSRVVESNTFDIKIDEYLNPWLYSYGFGFRSMIFGYYTKVDFAWPVENYVVKEPRIHITFGFDF